VSALFTGRKAIMGLSIGVALGVVLAIVLAGAFAAPPTHNAAARTAVRPASGSTEQWAFGGSASVSWSCNSVSTCLANVTNTTGIDSISFSFSYSVTWAVIYTQTNVSSTQTMEEVQAGLGANANLAVSECITNSSAPCQTVSLSLNFNGKEYGVGFSNLTTGTVNLTAGTGAPATVPAVAISNAQSSELFNFTGAFNANVPATSSTPAETESANFDLGGNESSHITFATPLGLVPTSLAPGDQWASSAAYSAGGGFTSGFSLSYNIDGHSATNGTWTSAAVTPSGQLNVTGDDLGDITLYDNYTTPATVITAQVVELWFTSGDEFVAADGWVFLPDGLFPSLITDLLHPEIPVSHADVARPGQGLDLTGGETADYQSGVGWVAQSAVTNSSSLPITGANSPKVHVQAGPEPVSVAQGQYSGILSPSSSSSGFPWAYVIIGVVVLVVVVGAVAVVVMRRRRKQPPTMAPPMGTAPGYPGAPTPPPPGYPSPPPPGPGNP